MPSTSLTKRKNKFSCDDCLKLIPFCERGGRRFAVTFTDCTSPGDFQPGRDPLAVSITTDAGKTFQHTRLVQHGNSVAEDGATDAGSSSNSTVRKGNEFSYPSILQTSDGIIHLVSENNDFFDLFFKCLA